MTIAIIIIAGLFVLGFIVKVLTEVSDMERRHEQMFNEYEKSRQKLKAEMDAYERELAERKQSGQPTNPIEAATQTAQHASVVADVVKQVAEKAKAEAERKAREAAATQAAKQADTQMTFGFEAPVAEHKPVDPNKPKRKSPIAHDVIHHDDNFWLDICREYQVLKHKKPKLTQTDFVKTKGDPTIKVKTFNEKMRQLAKTGMFIHKPRTKK